MIRRIALATSVTAVALLGGSAAQAAPTACASSEAHYQSAVAAPAVAALAANADGATEANVLRVAFQGYRITASLPICD